METYLHRYQDGEYEAVWSELTALGNAIRLDEGLFLDAQAVAAETMQRVQRNVVTLLTQLQNSGYVFKPFSKKYRQPSKKVSAYIARIERRVGPLPLSIAAFMSIVGSVNLIGYFPGLDENGKEWGRELCPDPLVFEYPQSFFRWSVQAWAEDVAEFGKEEAGTFQLEFAPDEYHKDNISGGPPYSIKLPNGGMDALVENEWHHTMFVPYLRECFRWGGFPGLSRMQHPPIELLHDLRKNLVPF